MSPPYHPTFFALTAHCMYAVDLDPIQITARPVKSHNCPIRQLWPTLLSMSYYEIIISGGKQVQQGVTIVTIVWPMICKLSMWRHVCWTYMYLILTRSEWWDWSQVPFLKSNKKYLLLWNPLMLKKVSNTCVMINSTK